MATSQKERNMLENRMSFYDDLITGLKKSVEERYEGKVSRLAKAASTHQTTLTRLIEGDRQKWLQLIARVADKADLRIVPANAHEPREVCFVDAKVVQAGSGAPPPKSEDYLAVPMVGEAGAGPGIMPEDKIESWILVYRNHRSVMRRADLLAVEIGKNQTSMRPTLYPGDIVLVDRNDWGQGGIHVPGNIFLVREPGQEGGGKVKRVTMTGKGDSAIITFYSDNTDENEPEPHLLAQLCDGNLRNTIVGKVVWAWADLSRK